MATDPEWEVLTGRAEYARSATELVAATRLDLVMFSQSLHPSLYGDIAFVEAMKNFLLGHERARCRVLVVAPATALRENPRLIELARRITSRFECRAVPEERREIREEYLISENRHYLHRADPGDLESRYFRDAPLQSQLLLKQFEPLWQESPPARELAELRI